MTQIIKLQKVKIEPSETEDGEDKVVQLTKTLVIEFTAASVVKMKLDRGFDIFGTLDKDAKESHLFSILSDPDSLERLVIYLFPDKGIEDWLNAENLQTLKMGILQEVLAFSPPHLIPTIKTIIEKTQSMIDKMGHQLAESMSQVLDLLIAEQLDSLPHGEKLACEMKTKLQEYLAIQPGS